MLALRTEGLSRRFSKLTAVTGLSLEVQPGDIYGFLGLNGAGKTTSIRMLLNLIRPDSGAIYFYDKELRSNYIEIMSGVGGMVDIPAFYAHLSGWDNLKLMSQLRNGYTQSVITEALASVGLLERGRDKVRTYSQGMRQRLGIANALLPVFIKQTGSTIAPVIILDEPTNGLDPKGIIDIRRMIKRLNLDHKATFIISTHMLAEVEKLCNRVGIIQEGRLIAQGTLAEVLKDKTSLEEYFV
ncbi:MAG: ABC transporter ATP-binding protein [Candidatus Brocadiia bacterium]